jgi:hypothetical protein
MRFRVGTLPFLFALACMLLAATDHVVMPTEIGVSCKKHKPFAAIARTTLSRVYPGGAQKTVTTEDRVVRDREGRVSREQHAPWTEDSNQPIYYINILDPKAWNVFILIRKSIWF